jgi:exonuclease VII large subunit
MTNIKQHLIEEATNNITTKEREIQESDHELEMLGAKLKVENKTLNMQDLKEHLKEDFKYSAQALEDMLAQEQQRNTELKKELEMMKYRKAVLESQFSDNDLDH